VAFVPLPGGGVVPADAAREVWESALCAQVDPELFFPEKGQPSPPAKAVCAACPVTALCLATFGPLVDHGVVGGLTAQERRQQRRTDRPAAA
jgi:WhiB family redox-sensing transcriptional regulator